ncbi:MAG TPA: glycosyltransferase family 4 protein [Stellaceae bacterium]|nr:glycosyltransferase family 4 protein [Stellaceae bacterium]
MSAGHPAPLLLLALLVFLASCAGSWVVMRWLKRRLILDHPVERSSHAEPVPKGSGIAVVTVLLAGWLWLGTTGASPPETLLICCLAFALGSLSWLNDVTHLPAALRLVVHLLIAFVGLQALPDRGQIFQGLLPVRADEIATLLLWTWFLNLFNFMDGIDGITTVETVAIGCGLAAVAVLTGVGSGGYLALVVALAAAMLGFLPWNWHPAKVFLGDVGSVPLGFVVGWLLLLLAGRGFWAPALLLPLYYLADATLTLARRLLKGERVWQAHRSHFYQRGLGRDRNHATVSILILICDLGLVGAAVLSLWSPALGIVLGVLLIAGLLALLDWRARAAAA